MDIVFCHASTDKQQHTPLQVNVAITFCDCDAPSGELSASGVATTSWMSNVTSTAGPSTTPWSSATPHLSLLRETASLIGSSWTRTTPQITTTTMSSSNSPAVSPTTTPTSISIRSSSRDIASTITFRSSSPLASQQMTTTISTAASASSPPTSNPEGSNAQGASRTSHNFTGAVGGVLGGVLLGLVLVSATVFFIRRRRRRTLGIERRRGLDPFNGGDAPQFQAIDGNKSGHATSYAAISSTMSPFIHSPRPRMAPPETVVDIRSSSPSDHTRIVESNISRMLPISGDDLPPSANLSSFSLFSPPGEEGEVSTVRSPVEQRFSGFDTVDPFADAQSVEDPPPSYMARD